VSIDIRAAAPGPLPAECVADVLIAGPAACVETCGLLDISSCDLNCDVASSVAPSDSVSRLALPRDTTQTFGSLAAFPLFHNFHTMPPFSQFPPYEASQGTPAFQIPQSFPGLRSPAEGPVNDAFTTWKFECERREAASAQANAEANMQQALPDANMQQVLQSMRSIVANLHMHFGTGYPPDRNAGLRRQSQVPAAGSTPDAQQPYHCNNNINAPNMNHQHATGGRGRGRRH